MILGSVLDFAGNAKLNNQDIVILSTDEWKDIPRVRHQITSYFSKNNRILFVENPRLSFLSILKDSRRLNRLFIKNRIKKYGNIIVYTPPLCLPFGERNLIINNVNNLILKILLKKKLRQINFKNVVLWCFYYNYANLIGKIGEHVSVYTAHDVWEEVPGRPRKTTAKMETDLITQVKIAIFSSKNNYEKKKKYNLNSYFISHGAPAPIPHGKKKRPLDLPKGKKIIGYWGLIDDSSLDKKLITEIANTYQSCNVVLIGQVPKSYSKKIKSLLLIDNVFYLGMKKKEQMTDYLQWFDVGLIPYPRTPFRMKCSPLKVYDYFTFGMPVVSINNYEIKALPPNLIYIAENNDIFLKQIEISLSENILQRKKRIDYCRKNTWDHKMMMMENLIGKFI